MVIEDDQLNESDFLSAIMSILFIINVYLYGMQWDLLTSPVDEARYAHKHSHQHGKVILSGTIHDKFSFMSSI